MILEIYNNNILVNIFTENIEKSLYKQLISFYVLKNSIFNKCNFKYKDSLHLEYIQFKNENLIYKYINIDL